MRAAADAQRVADESLKLAERTAARAERHAAKAEKRAEREAEIAAKELERVAKEAERVAKKAERAGIIQRMAVRTERIKAEEAVAHAAMLEEDRLTAEIDALHWKKSKASNASSPVCWTSRSLPTQRLLLKRLLLERSLLRKSWPRLRGVRLRSAMLMIRQLVRIVLFVGGLGRGGRGGSLVRNGSARGNSLFIENFAALTLDSTQERRILRSSPGAGGSSSSLPLKRGWTRRIRDDH